MSHEDPNRRCWIEDGRLVVPRVKTAYQPDGIYRMTPCLTSPPVEKVDGDTAKTEDHMTEMMRAIYG